MYQIGMNDSSNETKNILLIVTGASRGFGRACALEFCRQRLQQHLQSYQHQRSSIVVVLVGRSAVDLTETEQQLCHLCSSSERQHHEDGDDAERATRRKNTSVVLLTRVVLADLGDLNTLDGSVDQILSASAVDLDNANQGFDECVLINNAGSLGHIGPTTSTPSLSDMRQTIDLNVTSALWLSVRVGKWVQDHQQPSASSSSLRKYNVVNVSSLVAIQPFPTLAIYSAGKAARDAYHNSLAQDYDDENKNSSSSVVIRILNYAPGPLEGTDMTQQLREAESLHSSIKPHYQQKLVDVHASAKALMDLLQSDNFQNGQHVDYYDLLPSAQNDDKGDQK